eukprot:529177_1
MLKTESDAEKLAERWCLWMETEIPTKEKWTIDTWAKIYSSDAEHSWNGQCTKGIDNLFKAWSPTQGSAVQWKHLGLDIKSFGDHFVAFTHYAQFKTFDGKHEFVVLEAVMECNEKGEICRSTETAQKKYADSFNGAVYRFLTAKE